MPDIRIFLDNIRSVHNAGSIFRTAETLGISRIYCGGTTPIPFDRFKQKRKDFAKVALGAEEMVPWEHISDADSISLIKKLKKEEFQTIALEQVPKSIDYKKIKVAQKALVILGNEVEGVSPRLLKEASICVEIPLQGKKESLNVSVAAGIFLYRLFDR